MQIVQYDLFENRYCGKVEQENTKTVKVWYKGELIWRNKIKHNVIDAPVSQWGISYYVNPEKN